ncbi:uncharacterized protein LOC111102122 [Crassostrea virginica]
METRKKNWTAEETAMLVSLFEEHKDVLKGKFSPSLTNADKISTWDFIVASINVLGGNGRTVKEVKKKWQDLQTQTKKKEVSRKRSLMQTGGGPPVPEINEWEKKIIGIMSTTVVSGIMGGRESEIEMSLSPDQAPNEKSTKDKEGSTTLETPHAPIERTTQDQIDDTQMEEDEPEFETVFFTNPESQKTTCAKSAKPTYIDIKKKQRPKAQQKELEHTSELLAIQREMLGLMREDVAIKRKFLDAFQELVQIKKQKSEMHTKTYFEL